MLNEWEEAYRNKDIPWHTEKPEPLLAELVESGRIRPGKALDMCSGLGTNSIYLASRGFQVHGIDISETAVKSAKRRCSERGQSCRYIAGDVMTADLGSGFDFILDRGCFHHMGDKAAYAARVESLLKKGGQMFLQCFSRRNWFFWKAVSASELRRYFSNFTIEFIKPTVHTEPGGRRVHLHTAFMRLPAPRQHSASSWQMRCT